MVALFAHFVASVVDAPFWLQQVQNVGPATTTLHTKSGLNKISETVRKEFKNALCEQDMGRR